MKTLIVCDRYVDAKEYWTIRWVENGETMIDDHDTEEEALERIESMRDDGNDLDDLQLFRVSFDESEVPDADEELED